MNASIDDVAIPEGCNGFGVTEDWVERVVVVTASGDIDMLTAPQLDAAIYAARRKEPSALIVDLTKVTFLASAGMNLLIAVHREVSRYARFGVIADGPTTSRPLKLTGIDDVVAVYRSLADGLSAFADA
jgi:anti-anti-sigma factor